MRNTSQPCSRRVEACNVLQEKWSNMTENEFKTEVESLYESTFPIQHVRLEKTAEKLRK